MRDRAPVDVLIIGGGIQGLLILDRLTADRYSCLLVTAADLGAGQTLHSHGVLNTGFGMAGPGPLSLLRDVVLPDLGRRGIRTYGEFGTIMPGVPPGRETVNRPAGLELGGGAFVRLDEVNVDKVELVSTLSTGLMDRILRDTVGRVEHGPDGRVDAVELEPSGLVVAPQAVIVAAGTGSKALLRRLGAAEQQLEDIKHRLVHVLCVRGPSSALPALNFVSTGHQIFQASHEKDGVRTYLATPMQFAGPHHEVVPEDASAEVDEAFAERGWETLFSLYPPLASLPGLEFAAYAGFRQDVGDMPGLPKCEPVEAAPNVVIALPSGLLGAWMVAAGAASLVSKMTEPRHHPALVPEAGAQVRVGSPYENSAAVRWTASAERSQASTLPS